MASTSERPDLATAVRALAAERQPGASAHPDPADLVAHAGGTLAGERSERLQEHLVACAECARLVLDYADFERLEPPTPGHEVGSRELAVARKRLRNTSGASLAGRWNWASWVSPARRWQLVAAGLAAVAVGLGIWGLDTHQRLLRLERPAVNVAVYDLMPAGSDQVRSGGADTELPVVRSSAGAFLVLQLPEAKAFAVYRVEAYTASGERVWSADGAELDPVLKNFTLHLPPSSMPPGRYELRLLGVGDGAEETVAQYLLEVR